VTQTFTWTGTSGDDWFTGADWQPAGPPTAGSVARIDTRNGPTVQTADPTVDNVGILLAAGGATLNADGGSFGAGVSLTATVANRTTLAVRNSSSFDGTFGFAPSVSGGFLDVYGTVGETLTIGQTGTLTAGPGNGIILYNETVTNNGTLNAAGGLVSLYSGTLDGTGTITISNGGEFYSNQDVGAGETVTFLDQTGRMELYGSAVFGGVITNFQAGDQIMLGGLTADGASYDATSHILDVTELGSVVASFSLISNGNSLNFSVVPGVDNTTLINSSDAARLWNGGTADWYAAANWTSTPASPNSFPLAGDTVQINSGTATISAADVLQYGSIDGETIILNGASGAPAGLALDNETLGPNAIIETNGRSQFGLLQISGSNKLLGMIESQSRSGGLTIEFDNGGTLVNRSSNILSSIPSALNFDGTGTFINDGIVVAEGNVTIGSQVTFTSDNASTNMLRLQQGGRVTIDGTIENNLVYFGDATGYLTIDNLAGFQAPISGIGAGNRIILPNVVVDSVNYNAGTDTLTLLNNGTQVGQPLTVFTIDGQSGFQVTSDGNTGSIITYNPAVTVLQPAFPVPLVAAAGSTVSLQSLLIQAFGTIPAAYSSASFGLSYVSRLYLSTWDFSYWELGNKQITEWLVNGTVQPSLGPYDYTPPNPPTTSVAGSGLNGITLHAGTAIMPGAMLQEQIGAASSVAYYIPTVDPRVASPTIYSGIVDPGDIVASASLFATVYGPVVNNNDCGWIGDDVAAAAGATMPNSDQSTDPAANVAGGFWRVAYRGSDFVSPVQNWSTLVQPGDIVRMGWSGGGQHTTTVLALNPDGSIQVYDNDDNGVIGIHSAEYWNETIPSSITIYRLDPNHQYLVQGTPNAEFLQGSPYHNLIRPGGGADTIAGGAVGSEIQDNTVELNGITVIDWNAGDTLDVTDLSATGASVGYNASTGVLEVKNTGTGQDVLVQLSTGLPYTFQFAADASGNGTLVTTECFAQGTRLRTPHGDVAIEELSVGDVLLTVSDEQHRSRPIRWIGRREVDLRRHPRPQDVRPVRIAPHAFGPDRPCRALYLSPNHALYLNDVLIPVRCLIDGRKIRQLAPRRVTYWHVELDHHDAIIAEGLPIESYLDIGQRSAFENNGPVIMLHPDFTSHVWEAAGCAPIVVSGPPVESARAILAASRPAARPPARVPQPAAAPERLRRNLRSIRRTTGSSSVRL
jgi:hypothetical protein